MPKFGRKRDILHPAKWCEVLECLGVNLLENQDIFSCLILESASNILLLFSFTFHLTGA
jgi:hypothetical protein